MPMSVATHVEYPDRNTNVIRNAMSRPTSRPAQPKIMSIMGTLDSLPSIQRISRMNAMEHGREKK